MTCFYFEDQIYDTAEDLLRTLDRGYNGCGWVERLDMSYADACDKLDRIKEAGDEHVFAESLGSIYVDKKNVYVDKKNRVHILR